MEAHQVHAMKTTGLSPTSVKVEELNGLNVIINSHREAATKMMSDNDSVRNHILDIIGE